MTSHTKNNQRIAKNTLLLYFRTFITLLISLYTSRVILRTLGVEDFGIYNVVGGVVAMFGFINGSMTSATQRYITFSLGKGDIKNLQKVFSTALQIHFLIAGLIILLGETVGLWFMYEKMQIPADRISAAFWVLQCSIFSTGVMIISVPYNADIVAHEKMSAFAYISIIETILKLVIVYALLISSCDRLILYAFLTLAVQLLIRSCYNSYCHKHFMESRYTHVWDKTLFKEMTSFAGWSLWGNLASVLSTQGVNILLNIFGGPVLNAARGVAVQVQGAVTQFSSNFQTALNPQITKTYAQNNLQEMHRLIVRSSRFSFFLLFILSLPILLYTQPILIFWLKTVPDYSATFLRIALIIVIIDSISNPIMVAASATGKVRKYQSIVGGIILLIVPISYIVLKMGMPPYSVYLVHLSISITAAIVRLMIVRSMISLKIREYIIPLLKSIIPIILVSIPISLLLFYYCNSSKFIYVLINSVICVIISSIIIYLIGLERNERKFVNNKVRSFFNKKPHE